MNTERGGLLALLEARLYEFESLFYSFLVKSTFF